MTIEEEIEKLENPMLEKDILAMLENSLLCEKCWGRMIRSLEHEKFFVRLLKFYNGKYSHKYHPYAIKRLHEILDVLDKKSGQADRRKIEKDTIKAVILLLEAQDELDKNELIRTLKREWSI